MTTAISKLAKIAQQRANLEQEYKTALTHRRQRIGELAEKFNLLEMSDHFFAGLFIDAEKSAKEHKDHVKKLEATGSSALTPKRTSTKKSASA